MPRGDKSGAPKTVAKRAATYRAKKGLKASATAASTLRRWVPDAGDREACLAWLKAKGVDLTAPEMTPAQRLKWVRRAKREMVVKSGA